LGKVYSWYFRKLESIGLLNNNEKDEEEMLLNPSKIAEIEARKREQQQKKREELLDEENVIAKARKRFDGGERTILKDIAPAKDRVTDYKRKCFGRLFTGLAAGRDKLDDLPVTGSSSSLMQCEMTT
jgi:hypothetical protein